MIRAVLKLLRWPNLLLLLAVQLLAAVRLYDTISVPVAVLVMMTLLSTAAGYVINDILDISADRVNQKQNVFVSGKLAIQTGWKLYLLLLFTGFCCSLYLSYQSRWLFLGIYFAATWLLWLYSKYLKGIPVIGNLVVSLLCALAVLILWYPVQPLAQIPLFLLYLTGFAFVVTWIREVVKDLEDMSGDRVAGYQTFPLVFGRRPAKLLVSFLTCVTTAGMILGLLSIKGNGLLPDIMGYLTSILLVTTIVLTWINTPEGPPYHRMSFLLKLAMLTGTLSLVL